MEEKYRLTIDEGTEDAFVKEYTRDELESKKNYIRDTYAGRYKVDRVGDADLDNIDDAGNYTLHIGDFSKSYTGAELKGKMDYINQTYGGQYTIESSLGSYNDMDSLFNDLPSARERLEAFNAEHGAFMNDFEVRDSAETKISRAGMSSGLYTPTESAVTGEERQRYRDLYKQEEALKKAYYTSDEYLAQKEADSIHLSQMRDSIHKQRSEYAAANPMQEIAGANFVPAGAAVRRSRGDADREMQLFDNASRIMDDTIKLHNAPSKYDGQNVFGKFFKGSGDTLADMDFWTAGLTEIADNFGVRDVLKTVQDKLGNLNDLSEETIENILSPAEKAVLQAWAMNAQEQVNRKDDLSRAYQAGQGATESLGFMAEFALTGIVKEAVTESVEAMTKWLGRKVLGSMDEATAGAVKTIGEKLVKSTVGNYGIGLAESLAGAAGRTMVMPSTYRNIAEKATEIKEDGEGNKSLIRINDAYAEGYVDSFIENLSEGGRVNALGELVGDVAGKIPAYRKIVDTISKSEIADLYRALSSSGIMNTLRAGGWHGFGEEYLEEWYGSALRTLTIDKEALRDFATVDNQLVTVTSFLPMTIFGGTVSTAQVLSAKRGLNKKAEALKSALMDRGYDEAQVNNMIDMMMGSNPAQVSETLTPIVNAVARRDDADAAVLMKPVGEFAEAVRRWQAFDTKYRFQEQEQRDKLRSDMESTLGKFWQEDANGNQIVQQAVNDKGEVVYLLDKPSAQDLVPGEITPENAVPAVTSDGRKVFVQLSDYQLADELEMNVFLGNEIMADKGNKERIRMLEEQQRNIEEIKQLCQPNTAVNIGTAEVPNMAQIVQNTADGVVVMTSDGTTRLISYSEMGNYVGVNATPLTDAEIEEQEADALLADKAQREAELDQEFDNDIEATEELADAETEIEQAVEVSDPLPLRQDGSVDQTALWNKNPEKWAQWNDEQRQDGGANSLAYINGAISREQAKLAEMVSAYNAEPDFDARNAMESELAVTQERLNRLTVLQQNYVPQVAQQDQVSEQPASTEETPAAQAEPKPRERSVESEVARLYDLGLSDEEVVTNLDAKVAKAQKALDAQSKKAPKMGADENAYIAKKREHQQKMQELQQELDFATAASKAVNETLAQQSQAPETPDTVAMEKDPEPQNAVEFAARELGLRDGGIKLLWDSFKYHTGYGEAERHKFFGLFRTRQKGGMTIEEAGERLMELDRENGTGFFDQNDPNAGMNAILDALGDNQTMGELRSYTARQRQEEAQREADAAYSAMMAEYEATYGETMEETAHYDEVMRSEIFLNALSENEQQELNNIIFAEEISQYGTEGYQTEASGVYGTETGRDATDVESGTEGVRSGSSGVLQETQSDNSGRDAESQESQRGSESESGEQDALPSVPSGESTTATAVESSLDEDMPDFENMSDEEVTQWATNFFTPESERERLNQEKRAALRERIKEWEQKLGVQVDVMESVEDVTNAQAKAQILKGGEVYGWFESSTGKVAFYLPDFVSMPDKVALSEIDKTYIHEVVSHRGLRGLLGEEKYNDLCDKVWDMMSEEERSKYLSYPGVNGNQRIAADEFIAHFAEHVDYNDNRTLWDKIVDFIKDLLTFDNRIEISNEGLAEILRHSYARLARNAKAATNANANLQAEGNTVFRAANGSLVGMHNISEEKLRKALKQGGLANPSTAVVNIAEYLLDGYGDISLIMPSSLVDANTGDNVGTYTGDAWTPTYPPISRKIDRDGWKVIKDIVSSTIPEDSPLYSDIINGIENYLEDNRSSKMEFVFLKTKGIEPEIAYKGADGFVGMRNLEAILGVQGLRDGFESYERYKNASPMAKRSFNMWLDAEGNKQSHRELKEQLKKEPKLADVLKLNEDVSFADFDSFTYNIFRKEQDAGKIDTYDTMGAAARYVDANNLRGEFEAWLESLMEQAGAKEVFFAGYTRDGERIYKDNTLENVSRYMRLQGRTNAYDDHGLSATKSALLQRMTSLSQIRKNKARLQNESTYNKEYDALKDRLWSVISQLADMQQISSNQFMNVDYAESRLQEAFTKKNPIAHLNKEYGYDIDPAGEYADELRSFIKDVQQMPAKYFETKFERPVYLNEFAAAVMPTTTSEDIKQAVSEAGLPIFEYDSSVEGSRKEATLKATEGEGVRFRTAPSDRVLYLCNQARAGELGGKPISIGSLTKEGKEYLERISGIKLKENVSFVLNPSDLNHIYNDHYGKNEKDTGNNIPLNDYDIRRLVDVIAFPTRVVFGEDKQGRKVFYFLSETPSGTYNLMEIYANKKGNLTAKTYYKTKKGATQRVMELESLLSTSETYSGATLSDAKIPILFDIANQGNDNTLFRTRITPEQDAAYLKAVEAGDMETAQRMVNEAARLAGYDSNSDYQGSLAFNGAAPSGYGYYDTKEERIEAWENGEYEDDQTLGDYKDAGIDISNLGWNLTSPVARKMGNEFTRESIKNLADAINNDSRKIKIYRAVDANIKEGSIRNGDWVTPSRAYAEYHIGLQDWKEGRIIEQEVDIDDIWWDGNDINEWGYNDGKGYAYNNTPNNRKLLAPITYDDNGNVIPLSERFNPENEDIRFRTSNNNQVIFVSNAARAVEAIKQEKARPEQWLKMIEKNGGLKAGEDKWMGLSDWLKESDKKTLAKQEVLDFVNENMIQIEEVHYAAGAEDDAENTYAMIERILQEKFDKYIAEYYEQNSGEDDDLYGGDSYEYAMDKLREEMNDEFPYTIERSNSVVYLTFPYEETDDLQEWADKLGITFAPQNPINSTRLGYTTDGLNNKHEIALIVPSIEPMNESDEVHFSDAGDGRAVAWIRFGETWEQRPSPQISRKVLVIDEIQSKRHQEGREKGYRTSREDVAKATEAFQSFNRAMKEKYGENVFPSEWSEEDQAEFDRLSDEHSRVSKSYDKGIPDAPFDKNWHELAMKRMLRYAAENGYDVIAWTKGEQQAERYNLGKFYSGIERQDNPAMEGRRFVLYGGNMDSLMVNDKGVVIESTINEAINRHLSDIVGKELAVKMMQMEDNDMLDDADITIGGEGMKSFYDKMLPAFMNKYGKKWGIKVEDIELPNLEDGLTMHSVPVTEEMKVSVMEGQVMFRMRGENESAEEFYNSVVDEYKSKYVELGFIETYPINEETAKRFGYTLEELKENGGLYESDTNISAIFVHDDAEDSVDVEACIFHEQIHFLVEAFPYMKELGKWMRENANTSFLTRLKEKVEKEYTEEWHDEEMLTYAVSLAMAAGGVTQLEQMVPQKYHTNIRQIEKEIGYDRAAEESSRRAGQNLPGAENETPSRQSTEKEIRRASKKELTAEERRIINEYFPGAFPDSIEQARQDVDQNPTEAQKEAGNYRKGHLRLDGYNITIENPKGSVRRGTDSNGNAWENTLNNDYGYIRGTEGVDGDHIDVYLSDNSAEGNVFVIDQVNPETREFDEHKVMYGFNSAEEAREAYLANFSEGWNGLGTITEVSKDEFKKWIDSSHRKTKPFSEYKSVRAIGAQSDGMEIEDDLLPSTGTPTDEVVANGLDLSPAQIAQLAGNIFSALPEESRKEITDKLGSLADLQDAIMQIPTRLATKEEWNNEDKKMADIVASEVTKMAGEMTRPFSAEEGLWLLYNNLNKGTDLISQASRALVQRNLGFDADTLAKQEQAKEDVRFRTVGDATSNAQASLYNRGAVNVRTRLKESFVDMQASVEEFVKAIEKRTGKVAQGFENILLALNQQSSKGLAAMESYTQKFLNPMFDEIRRIMDETKMKYEDIVRYVILKHGLERNDSFAKRDAREYYGEMFKKVADRMKNQSHAQRVVSLSDAKKSLAAIDAKMAGAKGAKLERLKEEREAAMFEVTVAELVLRGNEKQNESDLKARMDAIDAGTDAKYQELRNKDYSGITSMFYDQLDVDRSKYQTEEEYQAALMEAKQDKYKTLADVEAAARAEVDAFEKEVNTSKLWKRINAATKEILRQQYEANMISKEQYESLRDMFQFYVPLRGFADNTAEDMYTYYRKPNATGYTKPILGAEGRKTEAESPFGWIAAMASSAIASNVKNEAKLALFYFVSNRPDNGVATISKTWFEFSHTDPNTGRKVYKPAYPPFTEGLNTDQARAEYEQWQKDMEAKRAAGQAYESGQKLNLGNAVVNISDANRPEHIVNVKVAGKDYTIIINGNPRAAQAINGDLNIEATSGDYAKLFGPVLRWMSSVNTSYNPEFWITNMQRDFLFTIMNVTASQSPAYQKKFWSNYAKAFKVISMAGKNEKGTLGNSYLEKMYQEFVDNGGVTGYTQIKDNETWEREIEKYMKSANKEDKAMGKVLSGTKDVLHTFHRFGESLEQVSRFAAFLTSREMGMSMAESINSAKEITVNFNRKGSGKMISWEETKKLTDKNGKPLNDFQRALVWGISSMAPLGRRFIMFFNASIQGLNAMYKLYRNNPSKMVAWSLGYLSLGVMQALLHAMMDDDDDYLDIPQYERRTSLMLGGNGAYFKWALPQEARAFYALGDLAVETIMGRYPQGLLKEGSVLGQALSIVADIAPINPTEGWKAFLPSVAVPFAELMINEDYKGDPIYNEQKWLTREERKRTAKAGSAYQGTGKMYIWISEALNDITGGDTYDAGLINIQPEKMEHLVQSAFGGTIRTMDKFVNSIVAVIDPEEEWTVRQTPFLNRVLTLNDERFRNVHVNDVYDYYKAEAEHAKSLQKKYTKNHDMEAYRKLMSSDEMQWLKVYERYRKPIKNLQEKIKAAEGTSERKQLMQQQDELKRRMIKEISELP